MRESVHPPIQCHLSQLKHRISAIRFLRSLQEAMSDNICQEPISRVELEREFKTTNEVVAKCGVAINFIHLGLRNGQCWSVHAAVNEPPPHSAAKLLNESGVEITERE